MKESLLQPLVSAIVSTYNSERFIRGCIEDLEQQTIADRLEIIVIDSASPQNEGAIVRELQGRYGNIRYLRTDQRETVYAAWNRGIALARGRYVTNANTDDRHRSDAFELMARVMDSRPGIDLVYGDVLITKTPNGTFEHHTPGGRYSWYDWDRNILLDKGCFIGPQPMWRRSLHELYGGFDSAYVTSGDYEFWLKISQTSEFFHIRQPLGLYLAHPDSIEHQNEDKKGIENSKILNLFRQAAREECIVGLLPFQQMRALAAESLSPLQYAQLMRLVEAIEAGLLSRMVLSGPLRDSYHLIKSRLLRGTIPAAEQIEEYLKSVGQQILGGKEWYANRRSVESTSAADEVPLRLELLSTAVQKARLLFQSDNVDGAVSLLLNQGIKAAPSSPVAYLELADILIASGRYEDALQVLPEMPSSADTLRLYEIQAICYAALGQDEAARYTALQAGDLPRALVALGTLAARGGNLAEAEQMFRRAIDADPSCGGAWLSIGMLLWGKGDQGGAYLALRQAVALDPLNDEAVKILRDMAGRLDGC
jgi:glycosyltransferase involved in cell wall biosynthesis/Flp pilus assembly protein TadD